MVFFGDRKKIEEAYKEWLKENPEVADSPFNVISFMVIKGLVKDRTETDFYDEVKDPFKHTSDWAIANGYD
jgi:hypothetical protein